MCVHLNSYIERLSNETLGVEIRLTDSSYLTASIESSPLATLFRQDLSLARAVFFVGYSLADIDIRRILFEDSAVKEKSFFILGPDPDEQTRRRASRFGTLISMGVSVFGTTIEDKSSQYVPPDNVGHIGYSIRKFTVENGPSSFSDQTVLDLLLLGKREVGSIWESLHSERKYFLERSRAKTVLDQLAAGNPVVVVHSELGNGKSLLIDGVMARMLERGVDVYEVTKRTDDLFRELDLVLASSGKTLIVIDDYADWFDVIDYIGNHANSNTSLLLSSRSSVHDIMVERVNESMGITEFPEIPVDRLSDSDIEWLVSFFDEYGLWADKAAWRQERKIDFINDRCGGRFYAILIMLLQSSQIASRFEVILDQLNNKKAYFEVILSLLILTVLHRETSINTLIDIWGSRILDSGFRRDPSVNELIDMQGGEIRLRSAVAAEFVLKNVANVNMIIDCLVHMAKAADSAGAVSQSYRTLLTKLICVLAAFRVSCQNDKGGPLSYATMRE